MAVGESMAASGRMRRAFRRATWLLFVGATAILAVHQHLIWSAAPYLDARPSASNAGATVIVLGASVYRDGSPSPMLADRLRTAAQVYASGAAADILVTGDGSGDGYDEVAVMRRELVQLGVPESAIRLDHLGFRTISSMQRAAAVYHVKHAVVVTNPFHLHRAVFLARAAGIDARGVAAERAAGYHYSGKTLLRHHAREYAARVLAWLEA